MTKAGPAGAERPDDDTVWARRAEVPDADADEQRRDLLDDPEDADPETTAGRDLRHQLAEPPLEVSEADLADQLVDAPFDDEQDRG